MSEETKHEKFVRIRDARMEKAQKAISLLGNLAAPTYEYSEEEAQGLIDDLLATVDQVRDEFGLPAPSMTAAPQNMAETDGSFEDDDDEEAAVAAPARAPAPAAASGNAEIIEIDANGRSPDGLLAGWGFVGKAMEAVEDKDLETAHDLLKKAMCA